MKNTHHNTTKEVNTMNTADDTIPPLVLDAIPEHSRKAVEFLLENQKFLVKENARLREELRSR